MILRQLQAASFRSRNAGQARAGERTAKLERRVGDTIELTSSRLDVRNQSRSIFHGLDESRMS